MGKLIFATLFMLSNLCFSQNQEVRLLLEIQTYSQSSLCIDMNKLTVIDSFPDSGMLRSYIVAEDDSVHLDLMSKFQYNSQNKNISRKSNHIKCFEQIGLESYQYDSTKQEKIKYLPENNTIVHFKKFNNTRYLITQDSVLWCFNLIIECVNEVICNKIGDMNDGVLFVDFFLFDFTRKVSPDIFVIKHTLIGPNELTYLQIYRNE